MISGLTFALRAQIILRLVVVALAALAAAAGGLMVAVGLQDAPLPLAPAARDALTAGLALAALLVPAVGVLLLENAVVRPIGRLVESLESIGRLDPEGPVLAESASLPALTIGVARVAARLVTERARTQAAIADLTELNRQLTRAKDDLVRTEKLATLGTLAAGVAHEIGNPLGAVLGYVELARRRPNEVPDTLGRIESEARRIDAIVRALLDFSRPQAAQLSPVYLPRAAAGALSLARMQKRFGAVEVTDQIDPAAPAVRADERRVTQVLVNLLINAADAMGERGRVILRSETDGARVSLFVADSGPGIPDEIRPRLFEPFFTTKPPGSGTGLGLAICARIMEECGGAISAGKATQGGAEFRLDFEAWADAR